MARNRDYKAEYARRRASGARRGLSGPQARGHARHGEASARPRPQPPYDPDLEAALRQLRQSGSLSRAAKEAGVSPERLRRYARANANADWRNGQWHLNDLRQRVVTVYSQGKQEDFQVIGFEPASLAGEYWNAAQSYLESPDLALLDRFKGVSIPDHRGKLHPLETDPNGIYKADAAGEPSFHEIYRIVQ